MPSKPINITTRTNGTHTGTSIWQQDRDAGTKIVADRHDTNDNDLATGINTCITKDGQNAFTGAINIVTKKNTNNEDIKKNINSDNLVDLLQYYSLIDELKLAR